ncbi:MAG: hypothetical protein ACHBN1_19320 [Heteroscytonema crispum UTEX LB 1556]
MYTALLLLGQLFYSEGHLQNLINYPTVKSEMVVAISAKQQPGKSKGSFQNMLDALGVSETGLPLKDARQYGFENPELGFLGKYQFAEILLIRLGYYKAKVYYGNGADKNYWRGTWTKKRGIDSKAKLLNSPNVQDAAIREAFNVYWQDVNNLLKAQGKSINNYLDHKKMFNDKEKSKTLTITLSGILAGAHLRGPDKVVQLLVSGKVSRDEFGTSILDYVEQFGGYDAAPKDFVNP